jgi:HPt (histidine-containing phosphotransfer) domain-containing protein
VELEMGLGVVAGVLPAYVRLLKKYLEIHEGAMDRFSTHLGVGEVHEARRAAHSLIGASGFIGAPRISRLAQDLERAMEEGDRPDLVRLRADALSREQSDLCGAIRTALRPFEAVPLS